MASGIPAARDEEDELEDAESFSSFEDETEEE
jgi:hypothetical protein